MEMNLYRNINVKSPEEMTITLQKSYKSNEVPQKGDFIKDSMFVDPDEIEVIEVTKNGDTYSVHLRPLEISYATDEHNKNMVNAYKANGWTSDTY